MRNLSIIKLLRIAHWWNYLIPPIMSFVYIACINNSYTVSQSVGPVLTVFITSILTASFGFLLNDYCDIEEDLAAGKQNHIATYPKNKRIAIMAALGVLSISFWFFITVNERIIYLVIAQFAFLIGYSVPPLRLKQNKIVALILDSLYSGTIFYLIALLITNQDNLTYPYTAYIFILIWGFTKGLRNILLHVISDRENDIKSENYTLATITPVKKLYDAIKYVVLPVEIFGFVGMNLLLLNYPYTLHVIIIPFLVFIIGTGFFPQKATTLARYYNFNLFQEIIYPGLLLMLLIVLNDYNYWYLMLIHFVVFPRVIMRVVKTVSSKQKA